MIKLEGPWLSLIDVAVSDGFSFFSFVGRNSLVDVVKRGGSFRATLPLS